MSRRSVPAIAVILLGFIVLASVYSLLTPVFEGPDEPWHFAYVQHLAQQRSLPRQDDPQARELIAQEVGGPPLYYALVALATGWIDTSDFPAAFPRNPHFTSKNAGTVADNKNRNAHTDAEDFPWHGATLAVRVGRLVTVLLAALAVLATWGIARELWPGEPLPPLLAALVLAATPMFLFVAGVISNDAPAAAFATLALWVMAVIARRGVTWPRLTALGLALAASWLTKVSTLTLALPAVIAIGWAAWTACSVTRWRAIVVRTVRDSLYSLGLAALVSGWWVVRNALLFNDPLGVQPHFTTPLAHRRPTPLLTEVAKLPDVWDTYWAAFGWGNILLPPWVYTLIRLAALVALVGVAWWLWRQAAGGRRQAAGGRQQVGGGRQQAGGGRQKAEGGQPSIVHRPSSMALSTLLLLLAVGVTLGSLVRWMQQVEAPHGRLLYPAAGALSVLLVLGWWTLARRVGRPWLAALPVAALVLLALIVPWTTLRPAYARPAWLSDAQAAALTPRLDWQFGDVARLVSVTTARDRLAPGQDLPVRLCWEPLRRTDIPYSVFVQLVGANDRVAALHHSYPGRGAYPTTGWQPGRVFCDDDVVPVKPDEINPQRPELLRLEVGLFDFETGKRLPVTVDGRPRADYYVGQVKTIPASGLPTRAPSPDDAVLGGQVRLAEAALSPTPARAGQPVTLTLTWQAERRPDADYQVLIHVLDAAGREVGNFDGPPLAGAYPTSWWDAGEVVTDTHTFQAPRAPGRYTVQVGLYRLDTGERLAVTGPQVGDDGTVQVGLETVAGN